MQKQENMDKGTWKKILDFTVELIKLIVATFLGATGALNI